MTTLLAVAGVVWIVVASVRRRLERRRWQTTFTRAERVRRGWIDR
jgi:hypothetical protein